MHVKLNQTFDSVVRFNVHHTLHNPKKSEGGFSQFVSLLVCHNLKIFYVIIDNESLTVAGIEPTNCKNSSAKIWHLNLLSHPAWLCLPHLILTDTLTLCQSEMADYIHHIDLSPPDLKMFHQAYFVATCHAAGKHTKPKKDSFCLRTR